MVIAARTGQGKTLTFGIPILDLLIRKIQKLDLKTSQSGVSSGTSEQLEGCCALIMSPTRELAIQIKDHIEAVIPSQHAH